MTRERNALLDRLDQVLPARADSLELLRARREQRTMRRRIAGGVLGLGITAALVGALFLSPWADQSHADRVTQDGWEDVQLDPGPGQYYYVRFSWESNGTVQIWLAPDGSGRRVWRGGSQPMDQRFTSEEGADWLVSDLSTDPEEFLRQLIERSSPGGASPMPIATTSPGRSQETTSVLRSMSDLLTFDSVLMPRQIQALFGAAQQIEEVTTQLGVVDPWGRPAVSLTHVIDYPPGPGADLVWYFDPDTGQFLGDAWVFQQSGKVSSGTVVEMAGIADSDDEVPPPGARFMSEANGTG